MKIKVFHNISPNFAINELQEFLDKHGPKVISITHAIKEDGTHFYTVFYDEIGLVGAKKNDTKGTA